MLCIYEICFYMLIREWNNSVEMTQVFASDYIRWFLKD